MIEVHSDNIVENKYYLQYYKNYYSKSVFIFKVRSGHKSDQFIPAEIMVEASSLLYRNNLESRNSIHRMNKVVKYNSLTFSYDGNCNSTSIFFELSDDEFNAIIMESI